MEAASFFGNKSFETAYRMANLRIDRKSECCMCTDAAMRAEELLMR